MAMVHEMCIIIQMHIPFSVARQYIVTERENTHRERERENNGSSTSKTRDITMIFYFHPFFYPSFRRL